MHRIGLSLHLPVAVIPPRVIPLLLEWTIVTVHQSWLSTFQLHGFIIRWRKIRSNEPIVGIDKGATLSRRCRNFAVRRRRGSKGWRKRGTLVVSLVCRVRARLRQTSHHPAGTDLVKRGGDVVTGDSGRVQGWYGIGLMAVRVSRPSSAKFKPPATRNHYKSDDQRDHEEIEAVGFGKVRAANEFNPFVLSLGTIPYPVHSGE